MPRLNLIGETIGKMVLRDLELGVRVGVGVGVRGLEVVRDMACNTSRFLENTLGKFYLNRCTGSKVKFCGLVFVLGLGLEVRVLNGTWHRTIKGLRELICQESV